MTRNEMLKLLKDGEDPLEISIQKWEDIVRVAKDPDSNIQDIEMMDASANNCALCHIYYLNNCKGCSVHECTKLRYCRGTPYKHYFRELSDSNKAGVLKFAKAELEFLRGLLIDD